MHFDHAIGIVGGLTRSCLGILLLPVFRHIHSLQILRLLFRKSPEAGENGAANHENKRRGSQSAPPSAPRSHGYDGKIEEHGAEIEGDDGNERRITESGKHAVVVHRLVVICDVP